MSDTAKLPEPGIHRDVPFDDYAAWPAINSGVVKWGLVSMKHMRAAHMGKIENDDTKDRRLGRGIHCRILEPEHFKSRFVIAEPCCAVTGKGQQCGKRSSYRDSGDNWFCGMHKGACDNPDPVVDCLTEAEVAACNGVAESLQDHFIMKTLRRPGWSEASLLWDWHGLPLKGRCDRLSQGNRTVILDLKKMQVGSGDRETCKKAIHSYGWYRQAAIYCDGVFRLTGQKPEFIWVMVEDGPPFDIQVIPATEEDLAIGWHEVRATLDIYKRACEEQIWPGYLRTEHNIHPGGLPDWFLRQSRLAGIGQE